MDALSIADRLIALAAESEPVEVEVRSDFLGDGEDRTMLETYDAARAVTGTAEQILMDLQHAPSESGWSPDEFSASAADDWTFGTALTIRGPKRRIHGGYMQPIRRLPIRKRVPKPVVLYLITVDRGEDYLERETHGMGWHY